MAQLIDRLINDLKAAPGTKKTLCVPELLRRVIRTRINNAIDQQRYEVRQKTKGDQVTFWLQEKTNR